MARRPGQSAKKKGQPQTQKRISYKRLNRERDKDQASGSTARATEPRHPAARSRAAGTLLGLTALAPLIVRSGRPFDDQAGADPARLPPPSTVAGCLRTALGRQQGQTFRQRIDQDCEDDLNALEVRGPLLLRENADGSTEVLVPKPADAHYAKDEATDGLRLLRAAPAAPEADAGSDLPAGLLPVRLADDAPGKPGPGPAWWTLKHLLDFRKSDDPKIDYARIESAGWSPPGDDLRTHVAIERPWQVAKTGQLFQTRGLDLEPTQDWLKQPKDEAPRPPRGIRLLVQTSTPLTETLVHLGGERRLAALAPEPAERWPEPPKDWAAAINKARGLSLTLLTPALFDQGWRPGWLNTGLTGHPPSHKNLKLRLRAAALERWQPQSGWDLARRQPRPARRMVPAGAVYWLDIEQGDAEDLDLWLKSICDREQDRRDGFGLVLPAPWTPPTVNK